MIKTQNQSKTSGKTDFDMVLKFEFGIASFRILRTKYRKHAGLDFCQQILGRGTRL